MIAYCYIFLAQVLRKKCFLNKVFQSRSGKIVYKLLRWLVTESLNIKNIEFLGALKHEKLADYYNLADVFVLPSVTSRMGTEGQGLVLLEAMSCGTPVIGTNTGGIPAIVKNNQTGILVNERNENQLANAVIKMLSDKKLSQRLSNNGIKFVKNNYSWDIIAKKFDEIYRKLEK